MLMYVFDYHHLCYSYTSRPQQISWLHGVRCSTYVSKGQSLLGTSYNWYRKASQKVREKKYIIPILEMVIQCTERKRNTYFMTSSYDF